MTPYLLNIIQSPQFQEYFHRYGYLGVYLFFITVDQLSPVPEEVTLIIVGYLASYGLINPWLAGLFSILAFFTIDVIYFYLTKSGNKFISRFTKNARSPKMEHYKEELKKNTPKTLLILSFIPRVRLLSPVFAALADLKFLTFMLYNGLGLAAFTVVYIGLGVIFHKSLSSLLSKMGVYQNVIFIAALLVFAGLSVFVYRKLHQDKK